MLHQDLVRKREKDVGNADCLRMELKQLLFEAEDQCRRLDDLAMPFIRTLKNNKRCHACNQLNNITTIRLHYEINNIITIEQLIK